MIANTQRRCIFGKKNNILQYRCFVWNEERIVWNEERISIYCQGMHITWEYWYGYNDCDLNPLQRINEAGFSEERLTFLPAIESSIYRSTRMAK